MGPALTLIKSFLTNEQYVCINKTLSEKKRVNVTSPGLSTRTFVVLPVCGGSG